MGARGRHTAVALALGIAVATCGGDSGEGPGEEGSDVRLAGDANLAVEWVIGDDPSAAAEYQFALVRDVLITPDGAIWVADGGAPAGAPKLRQYDSGGRFVRQVGRTGDGPGEYRAVGQLALMKDGTVAMRDGAPPGRVLIYGPDGSPRATWSASSLGVGYMNHPAGSIYVDTSGVVWIPVAGRPGPDRPPPPYLRVSPDGTVLDTVPYPELPEVGSLSIAIRQTTPSGGVAQMGVAVPYQAISTLAWNPTGGFAVARTDVYRIEILEPVGGDGVPLTPVADVVTRDTPPVPVPQAEREAISRHIDEAVSRIMEDMGVSDRPTIPPVADYKPPIKGFRFTDDGVLLVDVSMPSRLLDGEWTEATAYDVFDEDRRYVGRMVLPDSFTIVGMRGDLIWGVSRGEYDVESIRAYRITWH